MRTEGEGRVAKQFDGWPEGISATDKVALTDVVRRVLLERGPLSPNILLNIVRADPEGERVMRQAGNLLDHIYYTLDRAARAAGIEYCYRLERNDWESEDFQAEQAFVQEQNAKRAARRAEEDRKAEAAQRRRLQRERKALDEQMGQRKETPHVV